MQAFCFNKALFKSLDSCFQNRCLIMHLIPNPTLKTLQQIQRHPHLSQSAIYFEWTTIECLLSHIYLPPFHGELKVPLPTRKVQSRGFSEVPFHRLSRSRQTITSLLLSLCVIVKQFNSEKQALLSLKRNKQYIKQTFIMLIESSAMLFQFLKMKTSGDEQMFNLPGVQNCSKTLK